MRASELMEQFMAGEVSHDDLSPAMQSAVRLHIYNKAAQILALPSGKEMTQALDRLPEEVRELVRAEGKRIIELRKRNADPIKKAG